MTLSKNAIQVLEKRYLKKSEGGHVIETPEDMFHRVAKHIAKAEEEYGIKIPGIPIGMEYAGSFWIPRSRVYVRVGEPLDLNTPNLTEILRKEIARLSNLDCAPA